MAALGGYMAERVTDIHDVRARIVAELTGQQAPGIPVSDEPFILAAIDLAPADTATLDPEKVIALITSDGGPQAHTAILARGLGLPAIVAAKGVTEIADGTVVYVESNEGTLIPSRLTLTVRQQSSTQTVSPSLTSTVRVCWLTAPALSCTQTLVTASPLRRLQA